MRLAIAAILMVSSAFAQSRWHYRDYTEARRARIEARREVLRARREVAQARRDIRRQRREMDREMRRRW